jgi:tRNA dimethylallyltransferase
MGARRGSTGIRVVAIVGPTGVGKTRVALRLAADIGAEVVCADSRQVYRYMDIGTGKPTREERAMAPHHMLDVVEPDGHFDAADFSRAAREAIATIAARGRSVVVCGGSGLYVRALLRGLFPGPKADPLLRQRLAAELERDGPSALHARLARHDPEAAARLHPNDAVRVIRALEVCEVTGRPLSVWQREHATGDQPYTAMTVGVWQERVAHRAAIASRCAAMVEAGLVGEVQALWARGYGADLAPLRTLGYRHIGRHLRNECSLAAALEEMTRDTCRYAKRQLTWFRADASCRWYHALQSDDALVQTAKRFLEGNDA